MRELTMQETEMVAGGVNWAGLFAAIGEIIKGVVDFIAALA